MLRKHAGQSGIPCSAYGSLERDAKPMTRGEMYMKKFVVAILAMAMLLVTMDSVPGIYLRRAGKEFKITAFHAA